LGLYVFSEDLEEANKIVNALPNGSAAINDVLGQIAPPSMPFGGFGAHIAAKLVLTPSRTGSLS
jgi:acyl-CoA reductase-like NAD-dependent aldehyde dehydrogenase